MGEAWGVMASENAAVIERLVAAFNRHDAEALMAALAEDAELLPLRAQLEGRPYRGHEGARQMLADFDEDWEELRLEVDEMREAGDQVVLVGRLQGRGRTSGVDLDVPVGFLWRLRDGQVVFARTFSEPEDAVSELDAAR